jgi:hypothetical protein
VIEILTAQPSSLPPNFRDERRTWFIGLKEQETAVHYSVAGDLEIQNDVSSIILDTDSKNTENIKPIPIRADKDGNPMGR